MANNENIGQLIEINGITVDDMIGCAARELQMRKQVYPKWIADHRMSQAKADYEIATMRAIHDFLASVGKGQRQLI